MDLNFGESVGYQVRIQIKGQAWDQVRDRIWSQVWHRFRISVWDQVWDQGGGRVRKQILEELE